MNATTTSTSNQTEQTFSLISVQKNSRAGRLPVTSEQISEVLHNPPRIPRMIHEDSKAQKLNQAREAFLWDSFGLGPSCSTLDELTKYVAFLSCQPSTFSSYTTHIRNLAQNNLPLNEMGIAHYRLLRLLLDCPGSNGNTPGMISAVHYFRDCLGLNGPGPLLKKFKEGLAYLNPAGGARVRGSIGRDMILEMIQHPEFSGAENRRYRTGLIWQAAFGFRSGRLRKLRLSHFHQVFMDDELQENPTIRFVGARQKDPKVGHTQLKRSEIQTALPVWYEDLLPHFLAKRNKQTNPSDNVADPVMFPGWNPAVLNAKLQIVAKDMGLDPNLIWVSHGVRGGAASDAANHAMSQLDCDGSIEKIVGAVKGVVDHESDEMSMEYAQGNRLRAQRADALINTLSERRVLMNTSSPFFKPHERHQAEGRILLESSDAAVPTTLPAVLFKKSGIAFSQEDRARVKEFRRHLREKKKVSADFAKESAMGISRRKPAAEKKNEGKKVAKKEVAKKKPAAKRAGKPSPKKSVSTKATKPAPKKKAAKPAPKKKTTTRKVSAKKAAPKKTTGKRNSTKKK